MGKQPQDNAIQQGTTCPSGYPVHESALVDCPVDCYRRSMSSQNTELTGKIALVTGSTQGLGAAIARRLSKAGAIVVITGRSEERGAEVARSLGGESIFVQADMASVDDCRHLVTTIEKHFGAMDILVNSAADTNRSDLTSFTPEQFDFQFAVNVRAPLLLAQAALPMLRKATGAIINIGSVNAYIGGDHLLTYSATKGALMTASRNLANNLQHERVRVHCLNIGWIETDGERVMMRKDGHDADFIKRKGALLPLGQLLQPEHIADVVFFLVTTGTPFSGCVIDLEQAPVGTLKSLSFEKD